MQTVKTFFDQKSIFKFRNKQVQEPTLTPTPEPVQGQTQKQIQVHTKGASRIWGKSKNRVSFEIMEMKPEDVDVKMIYVEEREIDDLSTQIKVLNEISKDMANILDEQDIIIDRVVANVDETDTTMNKASNEMDIALGYKKKMYTLFLVIFLLFYLPFGSCKM